MEAGSRALRAEEKLDPRKLPDTCTKGPSCRKKSRNTAAQGAQPHSRAAATSYCTWSDGWMPRSGSEHERQRGRAPHMIQSRL